MMKKIRILLLILPLITSLLLLVPGKVLAQESGYGITIQKYKLSEGVQLSTNVPVDGTKAEKVIDDKGNQLDPLEGVSYEIVRVSPTEGTSEFRPVEGADAFQTVITTNEDGTAHADNLAAGTYRVSEKPTEIMKNVMEPVIVELPLPQRTGEALSTVYLYPKSSVHVPGLPETGSPDSPGSPSSPSSPTSSKKGTSTRERLPQTSGSLGTMQPLYLLLVFILLMGAIGGYYMQTKKHHF